MSFFLNDRNKRNVIEKSTCLSTNLPPPTPPLFLSPHFYFFIFWFTHVRNEQQSCARCFHLLIYHTNFLNVNNFSVKFLWSCPENIITVKVLLEREFFFLSEILTKKKNLLCSFFKRNKIEIYCVYLSGKKGLQFSNRYLCVLISFFFFSFLFELTLSSIGK